MAWGTAHLTLTQRLKVKAGETILILGAAGGVGLAAVELASGLGLRVAAAAGLSGPRGGEKAAALRAAGAELLVDTSQPSSATPVAAVAPFGAAQPAAAAAGSPGSSLSQSGGDATFSFFAQAMALSRQSDQQQPAPASMRSQAG